MYAPAPGGSSTEHVFSLKPREMKMATAKVLVSLASQTHFRKRGKWVWLARIGPGWVV